MDHQKTASKADRRSGKHGCSTQQRGGIAVSLMSFAFGAVHKIQFDRQQLEYRCQGKGGGQTAGKDKTI